MERGKKSKERKLALEPLRQRLDRWRSGHKGRWARIPEELWEQSVQAAARYGVGAVSASLGLDYYSLKSRLDKIDRGRSGGKKTSAFVEVLPLPGRKNSANAIELQKAGGSKLRIEFEGELSREFSRLSERLWRAAR